MPASAQIAGIGLELKAPINFWKVNEMKIRDSKFHTENDVVRSSPACHSFEEL